MLRQLALLFAAVALHAQSIRYEVPQKAWDKNLGTHRVVVRVNAPAAAVRANLEWRRRDPQPAQHGVVVMDAAGKRVENALATLVTNDAGEVVFQAAAAGEYFVYFLPGNPGSGSFPAAKYLGPQDGGTPEWKAAAAAKDLPAAKVARWEARTEHDRFNEMEIIATKAEKDAWLAAHPGDVHVFLESRERPVRMFDQVPEIWLKREKPPEFVARPGEVFMFQVCVWAAKASLKETMLPGRIAMAELGNSEALLLDAVGAGFADKTKGGPQAIGTVQPRWMYVAATAHAVAGTYKGNVSVWLKSEPDTGASMIDVPFTLKVEGDVLADGGDSEPWKHTKLRWLDSSIGTGLPSNSSGKSRQRIRIVPRRDDAPRPPEPPKTPPAQSSQRIRVIGADGKVISGPGATPPVPDEKAVPRTDDPTPPNAPAEPRPIPSKYRIKVIGKDGTISYIDNTLSKPEPSKDLPGSIPRPESRSGFPLSQKTPELVTQNDIRIHGRMVVLGDSGLPEKITSSFNQTVTGLGNDPVSILSGPMRFVATRDDGGEAIFSVRKGLDSDYRTNSWKTTLTADGVGEMRVTGSVDSEGYVDVRCEFTPSAKSIRDIRLEIPRTADTCKYSTGLGYYGGAAQLPVDWKWDVRKHQDAHWMGDVNAGLRVRLTAENYVRPMINIHYPRQPLNLPPSWGTGGIKVERKDAQTVLFTAYTGPRTLEPGKPLHFNFDLSITPFKPLNTAAQWSDRYFHSSLQDPAKVKAMGANIINIHQGNELNPYINYPFLTADKLREYADKVHALGMRVKYYYTIRELSNWTPELFALRSFGSELLAPGKGGGHAWLEEHLGGNYWGAWYEPGTNDASVLTATKSRFDNLYLEGLRWLIENAGCDGIYLDDISFDRTVMKRARKILDQYAKRGGLIDLHSWNELNGMAGFASNALIFMDSLPYVDRMWFGEGHHYNVSAEQMLVGISGIPFGVMGEMLEGGGNPWLGLPFGMTGRLGWGGNPQPVWKLWDDFGVHDSQFIGWWDSTNPVKTDAPDCRATIWKKNDKILIAVGNYSGKPVRTKLVIDWKALNLDPATCALYAPPMDNFQPELLFKPDAPIGIAPYRGFAFILDATQRNVAKPVSALTLDSTKLLFEDIFVPGAKDGWKNVASQRIESIKPDKEGLVILAPANVHAWTERPLPDGTKTVAAQIRQDAGDEGNSWGPGIALVWPDGKFLKANRRRDGRFGISINGGEKLTGLCDIDAPVTVAFVLEKEHIRIVATGQGTYEQGIDLARIPRKDYPAAPATLRLGKIPNSGNPEDHAEAGQMGWSRFDWVRVYRE